MQNWPNLSSQQQQLAGKILKLNHYRMFARRSDMAPFTSYAKDSNFLLDRGGKGRIAKQVLRKVGAFAAGYAIGKAILVNEYSQGISGSVNSQVIQPLYSVSSRYYRSRNSDPKEIPSFKQAQNLNSLIQALSPMDTTCTPVLTVPHTIR